MTPAGLDLARASVFLDFDGTVTTADVGVHLLERLGDPGWRDSDTRYDAGEIGSRECMVLQWACLAGVDEPKLRAVAAEVPLDPGLGGVVAGLRAAGAEVTVVSDGFGFYVAEAVAALGLDVLTNGVDFTTGEMTFPNLDPVCPCAACGTCKQAPIREAKTRGRITVFVGDGISDRKAAELADRVYAKAGLADWCDEVGLDHVRFERLDDVARHLLP